MKKTSLLIIFLIIFIDLLGFGIVIPLLPFYAREFSASGKVIGATVAVYSLMQFIFSPIWGRVSDRVGRRPVLLISLTGSVLGYATFAVAHTLPMLIAARVIAGIAGANIGTAQAYIADITSPENRARGMGLIGAAFGLGFILGPPMGGLLSSYGVSHGMHANFLPGAAACAFSLTALILALLFLGESRTRRDAAASSRRPPQFDPSMWRLIASQQALPYLLLSLFMIVLSFAGMETSVTLHGKARFSLSARELGYFFGLMGMVVAIIQGTLIGPLSRRLGERRVVVVGAGSLLIGLTLVPAIHRFELLYPVAVLIAIGQGLCYPALTSLVSKSSPSSQHGSVLGISSSVGSLSRMLGPVFTGVMYDALGSRGAFYAGAGTVMVALLLVLRVREPANTEETPAAASIGLS
jgi:multidrug resistance protein